MKRLEHNVKNLTELRADLDAAKTRARSLKTKKAREKAWNVAREIEREIFLRLCDMRDTYAVQSVKGTVTRDTWAGDDYIPVETCFGLLWLSPTTDEQSKSWYPGTCCIEYSKGQTLIIEIETDVNHSGLFLELVPRLSRGGTLNEEKYAELCKRDDLAFFKYPGADGVTGLFKHGVES
jgi:hypothetical protein